VIKIQCVGMTDVGKVRVANEDSMAVDPALGLFVVADGMGGHKAGKHASSMDVERLVETIRALGGVQTSGAERLRAATTHANTEIYEAGQAAEELSGMGTTLVALFISDQRAALAHVGDSRAYLVRSGRIRQLTDDHSVVGELLRRNEISERAARDHPHRHVITRALGVRPKVEPDLGEIAPLAGDTFVLCSDGLTNHLEDDDIMKLSTAEDNLEANCRRMVELAKKRGGRDNITVILVRCDEDEEQGEDTDPSAGPYKVDCSV